MNDGGKIIATIGLFIQLTGYLTLSPMAYQILWLPRNHKRPLPDTRTGHVLPPKKSHVYKQLIKTEEYAGLNEMKINYDKTKLMVFNPCKNFDFMPELEFGNDLLEVVGFLV